MEESKTVPQDQPSKVYEKEVQRQQDTVKSKQRVKQEAAHPASRCNRLENRAGLLPG